MIGYAKPDAYDDLNDAYDDLNDVYDDLNDAYDAFSPAISFEQQEILTFRRKFEKYSPLPFYFYF